MDGHDAIAWISAHATDLTKLQWSWFDISLQLYFVKKKMYVYWQKILNIINIGTHRARRGDAVDMICFYVVLYILLFQLQLWFAEFLFQLIHSCS